MLSFKNLTKRERVIFGFTLGIVAFSLMLNFVLLPVMNKFQALNQEIISSQLNLKRSFRLLAKRQKIQQDYSKISSLVQLEAGEEEVTALVLGQLENLATQAGLRIIDVRPQVARDSELYSEIAVELKQEGSIKGLLKFIYDLENDPDFLRVKKFQLYSKPAQEILECVLVVSKVYLPK